MATQADTDDPPSGQPLHRMGCWALLIGFVVLALGMAFVWSSREHLADSLISSELAKRGIRATYKIEKIDPRHEVLSNIVVGDPARPDLTIERAEVTLGYGFGLPHITGIKMVRPRLFGTFVDGALSFGELDTLIFSGEERPFEFPDFDLELVDGRAVVESDFGPVGIKLEGGGNLRSGFKGELGAIAPRLNIPGCDPVRTTVYGHLTTASGRPGFDGPVRFDRLSCSGKDLAVESAALQIKGQADESLKAFEGNLELDVKAPRLAASRIEGLTGTARFTWRDDGLITHYKLAGNGLATDQATMERLKLDGSLRARRNFERLEADAHIVGETVGLGRGLDAALANGAKSVDGTLLGPVLRQIRRQLADGRQGNRLMADAGFRQTDDHTSVVIPNAALRSRSGETILSLSRIQYAADGSGMPLLSGNFSTGGEGLPRIAGRMDQRASGPLQMRLSMTEYVAGPSRIEIPELAILQRQDGAIGFSGSVKASGDLPGGHAEDLVLPVSGNWSPSAGLSMWSRCTQVHFGALRLANLSFGRHSLSLCPARSAPILRFGSEGLRIAAGAPSLQLSGQLGETPITLQSGAVGFAYPGAISARTVLVRLGPPDTASTFAINDLAAEADKGIGGTFAGADIRLNAVPLDLSGTEGNWRFADGRMTIRDARFVLADREEPARFLPLAGDNATLTLHDNQITARTLLREPNSGQEVSRIDITHDLATGRGHADLAVDGLTFGSNLQPVDLTRRAEGVIALANGTIAGIGRIDWDDQGVTGSSGRFSSKSFDFAAPFGPVKGASGTVIFSDLLGLTTAPEQRLHVASVNPGIEINDGEITFDVRGGEILSLHGGAWPFMGGTLRMLPVEIRFGASEVRRYVLEIEALDAARFVDHMELNNLAATGYFDGTVPLVFDREGNGRVEGGLLVSRSPGGNVSYVGDLTYEDLGAVANIAFDALRSLDYRRMTVQMDGTLTGEIVTRVMLDGVSQGKGSKKNLLTNAVAGLPIRVDVNIRAPFYQLIGTTRALYDPAAIRDPREVGLIDSQGNAVPSPLEGREPAPAAPQDQISGEAVIQRRESEEMP